MPVKQHGVVGLARQVDHDDRRPPGQPDDFQCRARHVGELCSRPALEQPHGLVHIAVRRPIRVEGRGFVGDADVFYQCRNNLVGPALIDEFPRPFDVHHIDTH